MSSLPPEVQIGPFTYRVVLVDTPTGDGWAYIAWERREIQVKSTLTIEFQRVALWHEILHGINDLVGKDVAKWDEESYVRSQAPLTIDTLRRNPALVAFLVAADA